MKDYLIKHKFIPVIFIAFVLIGAWFSKSNPNKDSRDYTIHEESLVIGRLNISEQVKRSILSIDFDEKKYLMSSKLTAKENEKLGKELYKIALSKGFYSKHKLRILKISKLHLLKSKEIIGE